MTTRRFLGFRPVFWESLYSHTNKGQFWSSLIRWHGPGTLHMQVAMLEHGKSHWPPLTLDLPIRRNSSALNGMDKHLRYWFQEMSKTLNFFHPFQVFLFCCNTAIMACHPLCDGLGGTLAPHLHTAKMLCLQAQSQHMLGGILMRPWDSSALFHRFRCAT